MRATLVGTALVIASLALGGIAVSACVTSTNGPGPVVDAGGLTPSDGALPSFDSSTPPGPGDAAGVDASLPPGDGAAGNCPAGWVDTAQGCFLDLQTGWSFSTDANTSTSPTMTLVGTTPTSVTVSYVGGNGSQCGCNAEHLIIPLGKSYDCATTTLQFDYTTNATPTPTSSPSVDVHFCSGTCGGSSFYGGSRFMGSEYTGSSNCAVTTSNHWPATPQVKEGTNVVPLGGLDAGSDGYCNGTFDSIDVHVAAYACFATETGTMMLSKLKLL